MSEPTAPVDKHDPSHGYELGDADSESFDVLVHLDSSPSTQDNGPWVADVARYQEREDGDDIHLSTRSTGQLACRYTETVTEGGYTRLRCWQSENEYVEVAVGDVAEVETLSRVRDRRLNERITADIEVSPEGLSVCLHRVNDEWQLLDEYWRTWAEIETMKSDNHTALLVAESCEV